MHTPLQRVGVRSTPIISQLEILGERGSIYSIHNHSMVSSVCLVNMVHKNVTTVDTCINQSDFEKRGIEIDATFVSDRTWNYSCNGDMTYNESTIVVSAFSENSDHVNFATAEWIYYLACFFNKEDVAVEFLTNMYGKWDCLAGNIKNCDKDLGLPIRKKVIYIP